MCRGPRSRTAGVAPQLWDRVCKLEFGTGLLYHGQQSQLLAPRPSMIEASRAMTVQVSLSSGSVRQYPTRFPYVSSTPSSRCILDMDHQWSERAYFRLQAQRL